MFNLNDIIQSAQGGAALDNLAGRFGLSREQAQQAVEALLPAFSMGLQNRAQSGEGIGAIFGRLSAGDDAEIYDDPTTLEDERAIARGNGALGEIFGSKEASRHIAQNAAELSGVPTNILKQMLPMVAAMLMGGMFKNASQSGLGGLLGQLAGMFGGAPQSAPQQGGGGGIGDLLGQMLGGGAAQQAGAGHGSSADRLPGQVPGDLADLLGRLGGGASPQGAGRSAPSGLDQLGPLGGLLGGLFGGGQEGERRSEAAPQGDLMKAGLDALGGLFQSGAQAQQGQQQALQDIFARFGPGARRE